MDQVDSYAYYMKGRDVQQVKLPGSAAWMVRSIFGLRETFLQHYNWDKYCVSGKFHGLDLLVITLHRERVFSTHGY